MEGYLDMGVSWIATDELEKPFSAGGMGDTRGLRPSDQLLERGLARPFAELDQTHN